ncbi:MAG: M2 family metallopeptidase [Sphingomonadales bacterium]|nr:M2 family metallopeptidase [Sphingomonadales bacterium]
MKFAVSSLALALSLSLVSPALAQTAPTAADADKFVAAAEKELGDFTIFNAQVSWINQTYITDDTDAVAARVGAQGTELGVRYATEAAKYQAIPNLSYDTKRKLDLLRGGLTLPAPTTEGAAVELNTIATRLQSAYGKGKGTLKGQPIGGSDIEAEMGTNRDPDLLKEMWASWNNNVGSPMRADYAREVEIANAGARELGYADVGAMWRSQYDMPADEFAKLTDKLWTQVKPLYDQLHCYTRTKLNEKYGDVVQAKTGPIRADLLGNMWAQEWGNIYEIVAPKGAGNIGYDTGELHNFYQRAYNKQPLLYLNGANDGFHEAIGDFIALSITPQYLVQIGLLDADKVPSADKDVGLLLRQAMDKVAFLPFGLLVDKYRWDIFAGKTPIGQYNKAWTDLRLKYQGIIPPVARDETNFDAGAKYHVPGNVPYTRYFLARILQFQFYKAACDIAKWKGPLHRCSFYGNKEVGARLNAMLAMGASKPWPDALQAFTGSREMDGTAMVAYFKPLMTWLKKQNKGKTCNW